MDFAAVIPAFDGVVGTLNESINLFKTLRGWRSNSEVDKVSADLANATKRVIELQLAYSALLDEYQATKNELGKMKAFDQDSPNYHLHQIIPGSVVYVRKSGNDSEQPALWFCVNCFENRIKSVLLLEQPAPHADSWKCPRCNARILVPNSREELSESVSTRRPRGF